ncbi:MAG TPA: GFA family protein [Kofleriaceae bacterium]|nr:GFA family protein [Kofleriaceae bacterium]
MSKLEGHCYCGAVKVSVPADAFGVIACHCDDCQKMHGNFFAMLRVEKADASWTGEDSIQWYQSSEKVRRSFCKTCGSRLAKDPTDRSVILVSVGLFDRTLDRGIQKQVHEGDKPAWYDLPATRG